MTAPPLDYLFLEFQAALAGRYSIDREIGRGGMGIVYLAREVHLDRPVAIKLLPPDRATPELRARFLGEARLAAKLSHPNIIPIHAVEEHERFVWFVMAYVDGETLADRVRGRGPLGASEGARVLREVAWALAYAHEQGLVHRDVKPDNILLERGTGRVLVADFGIAAAAGDAGGDGVTGTPEFMSPEQALGTPVDARSDLYSLGATAFYAFSGRFPFEGASATEILAKQVTEPAPPLGTIGVSVPRKVASLVDRCLAKDPAHRPASAQALAEALGLALEQRKEIPAALRAFVKRSARLDSGGTLVSVTLLLFGSAVMARWLGVAAGFSTLGLIAAAVPMGYFVKSARQLLLQGFTHDDLPAAFRAEQEQTEEEMSMAVSGPPNWLERWLPRITRISLVLGAGGTIGTMALMRVSVDLANIAGIAAHQAAWTAANQATSIFVPTFIISLLGTIALGQRRSDVDTAFWGKLWTGRIGRLAFGIAKRLIGNRAIGPAMTHRATELSLGMAAEQLYAALPKKTRQALPDVPKVLKQLQEDAQRLRKRCDEIQDALAECDDVAGSEGYAELATLRDAAHARLAEAVGSLETIRLDLLRLHAGSITVASVTTNLGIAAEVSTELARLVAAHEDVERVLNFPRGRVPSPV